MSSRKPIRVLVMIWLAAILAAYVIPFSANAAPVVIPDEQGANDQPGQKDLTLQFLDNSTASQGFIELGWNWDDTSWSGSNSGDTCALFDTDNDGLANRALCVSIGGAPAVIESGYPKLYTCSDTSATRCFGSQAVASFTSTCSISITSDQPFAAGTDTPNDTKSTCHVVLTDVGGSADNFINSCSYPSQSPNSNAQDCVLFPRDAFVTIVKDSRPDDDTPFNFTLQVGSNPPQAFATINGSGSDGPNPVPSGQSFSIAEVVPTGWALDSIVCTRNGSPIGTVSKPSVTMTLGSKDQVTCTFVDIKDNPSLIIDKELLSNSDEDGSNSVTLGDTLNYRITATNNGNVGLTGVTVTDSLIGTLSCTPATPASLAPGASVVCTGSHTVTQAEVDAGQVENTGTADSNQTGPVTDTVTVPITRTAAIQVDKIGTLNLGQNGTLEAGDVITYQIKVKNTGNVTLSPVTVSDPGVSNLNCGGVTSLTPGQEITCTASHTLTQADIDAGQYNNTATGTGTPPSGPNVSDTGDSSVTLNANAQIQVDKSGTLALGPDNRASVGDLISYTITVKNIGNVTLNPVVVTDPNVGDLSCPQTSLAPGASMDCTATHAITQADINAGKYDNTATGTGTPPGNNGTVTDTGDASVPIPQVKTIDVTKSGVLDDGADDTVNAGDVIHFTVTVTNTGNVTVTNVTATDPKVTLACDPTTLLPGASSECKGDYTITQDDIDAGKVLNTALACVDPPTGDPVCKEGGTEVPIPQTKSVEVTKTGVLDDGPDDLVKPGDVIHFTVLVRNTGNVTLTGITATDPKITTLTCTPSSIGPGETSTCTGDYTITQADIDAGKVDNTATGCGLPPSGPAVCDEGSTTVPIPQTKSVEVTKTGVLDKGDDGIANAGDVITFTVTVENTGNVTLTNVTATDPKITTLTCDPSTIGPGQTSTCTGTYEITQADVDAGKVENVATGCANPPSGDPVCDEGETEVPIPQSAGLQVDKTGTFDDGANNIADAGEVISYTVTVKNTGTVTLDPVVVNDPKVALTCEKTKLAPQESMKCTGTYTITQADIDAGKVDNIATGTGTKPDDTTVTDTGEFTQPLAQSASISVDKTGTLDAGTNGVTAGDIATYTVTVKNTGNVTLNPVTVSDPLVTNLSCPKTSLAPGESMECKGTYAITQANIDAGKVDNTATGTGTPPSGSNVTDTGSFTLPLEQGAFISVDKTGTFNDGDDDVTNPGDVISYKVTVKNTGNVTLDPVTVSDPLVTNLSCPKTTLAPGESMDCTGTYAITQADIDAGKVDNTATGTGTPPSGNNVTDTGSFTQPLAQTDDMMLSKGLTTNADEDGNGKVSDGDTITYTISVKNTGNTTLTGTEVSDPIPDETTFVGCDPACATDGPPVTEVTWTVASIAPGQTVELKLTVRVGELTSCQVCNQASATSPQATTLFQSNRLCVSAVASPHPENAHANGSALGAKVVVGLLNIDQTFVPVSSSQSGIGADVDADSLLSVAVPPPAGSVAKIGLLQTQSNSVVGPTSSNDIGTAEVANVNLLNGTITANVVRAVASATADGQGAGISSLGSTFVKLKVNGVAMKNVAPNTKVNLPAALFGPGSFVRLYERIGKTTGPAANQLSGGTYTADLTVNMIHVYVTDLLVALPGLQPVEIIVSGAVAHADFPQTTLCVQNADRHVSGHAFIASAIVSPIIGVTVGEVNLEPSGGSDHADLSSVAIPDPDGTVLTTQVVDSNTIGQPLANQSAAASYAQAANVCLLADGEACTVGATLIRSKATSIANAGGASSNDNGTVFVGLEVGGTPIEGTPDRNTVIEIPGVGFVILNEQFCDSPGTVPTCTGQFSTGLTVRAIRLVVTNTVITEDLGIGIQVIVAEAHSDATWHPNVTP